MRFYADLHIHSKYSRATSRDCDLENLAYWGRKKGITVIGTGDFTHPAWFKEIQEKLIPAEPGLFKLTPELERQVTQRLPSSCQSDTRFMISVEISTIYKKGDKVRKIHHLIYAPSFEKAEKIRKALEKIGNIRSDGRPILGLDSRHLLEIVLSAGEDCYLVPAHIWTPWFAVLGSKSGFDNVADCYADLANHVFAVETGLSSDPEMNWKISHLDRYRLMSNSDAHSPGKLGREVNVFNTELDYYAMLQALQTGKGFGGTLEFFPEEGKYHLDGHRKCEVRLTPEESKANQGLCPECKKPLTLGVLYRVEELADRPSQKPQDAADFKSVIPLPEIIGEILDSGVASQGVSKNYEQLLFQLGSELDVLNLIPVEQIKRYSSSLLAEAISRMRSGKVIRDAGYDGEYGKIKLFKENELKHRGGVLFDMDGTQVTRHKSQVQTKKEAVIASPEGAKQSGFKNRLLRRTFGAPRNDGASLPTSNFQLPAFPLDPDQSRALSIIYGPLLIVAGPGSGKTRTLTHRVAHLIREDHAKPEQCLTLTFTRRAANEMKERLEQIFLSDAHSVRATRRVAPTQIPVLTFHALGLLILEENRVAAGLPRGFRVSPEAERVALLKEKLEISETKAAKFLRKISEWKRSSFLLMDPRFRGDDKEKTKGGWHGDRAPIRPQETSEDEWDVPVTGPAQRVLSTAHEEQGWLDYDDLLIESIRLLEEDAGLCASYRNRFRFISIDEYQDIDELQYRLIRLLVPSNGNICAIGDPDQSIYSFRGAKVEYFLRFKEDFDSAVGIQLTRNYRSGESIILASNQMIASTTLVEDRKPCVGAGSPRPGEETSPLHLDKIVIHHASTDKAEAEFVVHTIEQAVGGTSFFSLDSARSDGSPEKNYSFADFVVLYRTEAQADVIAEAFERSGIPFQRPQETCVEEIELWDPRADRVRLMTLHAVKGLEFSVVFITGCEEGLLPLYWQKKGTGQQFDLSPFSDPFAEERRLFYVGMTRAKDRLFLSAAKKRFSKGKVREQEISRFLKDIEEVLIERSAANLKKKIKNPQMELL